MWSVSEVETVFTFLPDAQDEKLPLIRSLGGDIPEIHPQVLAEGPPNMEKRGNKRAIKSSPNKAGTTRSHVPSINGQISRGKMT